MPFIFQRIYECVFQVYFVSSRRHFGIDCDSGVLCVLACALVFVCVLMCLLVCMWLNNWFWMSFYFPLRFVLLQGLSLGRPVSGSLAGSRAPAFVLSLHACCWDSRHMLPHLSLKFWGIRLRSLLIRQGLYWLNNPSLQP